MKVILFSTVLFTVSLVAITPLLYFLIRHRQSSGVCNTIASDLKFPAFTIGQSRECSKDMEEEKTKNHQFDDQTPYPSQIRSGMHLLNQYKISVNVSLSTQYQEGQNG